MNYVTNFPTSEMQAMINQCEMILVELAQLLQVERIRRQERSSLEPILRLRIKNEFSPSLVRLYAQIPFKVSRA